MLAPVGAGAQQAAPPTEAGNLMPNSGYADKNQLSDAFDGVDSLAHLTAVGGPTSTQATWYVCVPPATRSER
jgi:hypothetical protein